MIACFAVLITIQITTRPTFKTSVKPTTMNSIEVNRINAKPSSFPLHKNHSSRPLANSFYYVIGVLLSQGNSLDVSPDCSYYFYDSLLRTNEAGLNLLWSGMYHSLPAHCKNDKKNSAPKHTPQLSFKNLVGSFILLAIGCAVSLIIFILELVFYRLHRRGARQHPAIKRNS